MAQQIGDVPSAAGGDRLGAGRAQVTHHRQRVPEGGQGALYGRTQFSGVLRRDAHRVEHTVSQLDGEPGPDGRTPARNEGNQRTGALRMRQYVKNDRG